MKYAYFDKRNGAILAWFDTDSFNYALPDSSHLHECTNDEWLLKETGQFMVQNNTVVPFVPPALDIPTYKSAKKAILEQAFQDAANGDVTYNGVVFQGDEASQLRLSRIISILGANQPPQGFFWVAKDNTQVSFALADLRGLAVAMFLKGWAAFKDLQTKKAALIASQTQQDVDSI